MTAKEKAEELVEKFRIHCYCYLGSGMLTNTYNEQVQIRNAKQCAIIAVDEIVKAIQMHDFDIENGEFEYWADVKSEIERL